MNSINRFSHIGFNLGLISSLFLMILMVFMKYFYRLLIDFDTIVFVILCLFFGIVSILELPRSIKGIKELPTVKKNTGIILNIGFVLLFLFGLISYAFDLG